MTNLLQNNLPRVEPLEVDDSQDQIKDGRDNDDDGQQPGQQGKQVKGLVLLSKRSDVVQEDQVFLPHF